MKKILILLMLIAPLASWRGVGGEALAQAPGTAPVKISTETQVMHGKKYFVHIVEKGQTVYSISKAYKVESYDAVTHVDIHFLHPGDTVWIPCRGQLPEPAATPATPAEPKKSTEQQRSVAPTVMHPTPKGGHRRSCRARLARRCAWR